MEEKRINGGYEIIESCTIGNNELVIGHNAKAPNPYVCWYCRACPEPVQAFVPQPVCVLVLPRSAKCSARVETPTRMCVGTARTARIIFGDITAISYRKRGKS